MLGYRTLRAWEGFVANHRIQLVYGRHARDHFSSQPQQISAYLAGNTVWNYYTGRGKHGTLAKSYPPGQPAPVPKGTWWGCPFRSTPPQYIRAGDAGTNACKIHRPLDILRNRGACRAIASDRQNRSNSFFNIGELGLYSSVSSALLHDQPLVTATS